MTSERTDQPPTAVQRRATRESPADATPAAHGPRETAERRDDIEGLRAVAVILVVLFHASLPGFSGGFVGVDVFFVISGFLITGLLLRELEASGRISLPSFYARRARRLLPAAALVLVVTLLAAALLLPPLLVPDVAGDTAAAALYVSNMRFAVTATDYFAAGGAPSPILHYWSLGVEEQFYVFWPAILVLVAAGAARLHRRIGLTVLAISLASFGISLWLTGTEAPLAFFLLPARAWELGLGAMLAVAGRRRILPGPLAGVAGWLGLGLIGFAAVALDQTTPFPGWAALLPTVGAALVIASGIRPASFGPAWILGAAVPRFVGRISYSLYLWHWPLLVLPAVAVGAPLPLWARLGLVAAAIVLAAATQRWVEDPIRRGRLVGSRPRPNLAMAGALTVAVALVAVRVGASAEAGLGGSTTASGTESPAQASANEQSLDSILNALASQAPASPGAAPAAPGASPASSRPGPHVAGLQGGAPTVPPLAQSATASSVPVRPATLDRPVPANLQPPLWFAHQDYPQSYLDGCHTQQDGHPNSGSCLYGNLSSSTTIALFGDSHALSWFPAVELLAQRLGWRLLSLTMSTCSPADLQVWNANYQRVSTQCSSWREQAIERLVKTKPAVILVTGTRGIAPVDSSGKLVPVSAIGRAWQAGMARTLARLTPAAGKVVLIADTPASSVDPPVCLSQHPRSTLACATPVATAISQSWLDGEKAAAAKAGAGFIDPTRWVCPTAPCPVVIGDILIYRDGGHMSTVFSAALAKRLGDALEAAIASPPPQLGRRIS